MHSEKELEKPENEKSISESLSKDAATQLVTLMKNATRNDPSPAAINAACNCAKALTNILRLQFEVKKYLGK